MAKDIFVETGRKMKTVGVQGEMSTIELTKPVLNEETMETEYENDLSEASFDVVSDVGPSSTSKKASTVRALTGMMQTTTDPETMQVLSAMTMMNMEGEGISEVRDFFRKKLLRMGAAKPTENEEEELKQELANRPKDPNTTYLEAAAAEADAKAKKANADTINTIAKAEKTQAETAEIFANMSREERTEIMAMLEKINEGGQIEPFIPVAQVTENAPTLEQGQPI